MEKTAITTKDLCTVNRPEKQEAVITAKDLCIGYRSGKQEKRVHEHLSFRLFPGELTCLLGANGTGKSTLLRTLSASQPALSGELSVQGKPLSAYSEKERFAHHRHRADGQDSGRLDLRYMSLSP